MMKNIEFKYKFDDTYNPKYVNGAIGGFSPKGELVMNFYLERRPIPRKEEIEIDETSGKILSQKFTPQELENTIIRFVDTGVTMSFQTAKEIHKWLGNHIEKFEKDIK